MVTDTTREDFRVLLSKRLLLGRALQRLSAQMIPVPTDNWLHEFNERCRLEGVEPAARPLRAFRTWVKENNLQFDFGLLGVGHLDTPAWAKVFSFFQTHTSVGRENRAPLERTCFFYEQAFWEVHIPIICGAPLVDPIRFVADMPTTTLTALATDSKSRDELDEHWIECAKCVSGLHSIDLGCPCLPFAAQLLSASGRHLRATVDSLLTIPPNSKSAEYSRMAFECALKGLAAGEDGMVEAEAIAIRHDLRKLVKRCAQLIDPKEKQRLDAARKVYPKISARYDNISLRSSLLWNCYFEARHALALAFSTVGLL